MSRAAIGELRTPEPAEDFQSVTALHGSRSPSLCMPPLRGAARGSGGGRFAARGRERGPAMIPAHA